MISRGRGYVQLNNITIQNISVETDYKVKPHIAIKNQVLKSKVKNEIFKLNINN